MFLGPARGWFQRSRVLQIQASVKMLLDWAKGAGHNHLAQKFFAKFCSAVSILATPPQQLSQVTQGRQVCWDAVYTSFVY